MCENTSSTSRALCGVVSYVMIGLLEVFRSFNTTHHSPARTPPPCSEIINPWFVMLPFSKVFCLDVTQRRINGHLLRPELTREGFLVKLANHYTTWGAHHHQTYLSNLPSVFIQMWNKAVWIGNPMRLELTREGLQA